MGTLSVFESEDLQTVDGMVVGPAWTEHRGRELLRFLRVTRPAAPDSPDIDEQPTDVVVAARVFHEVLTLTPASIRYPVFSATSRHSLFRTAILHAHDSGDLAALCRLSDQSALQAVNVARWLMQLPQQHSLTLVFAAPPSGVSRPSRVLSRATAREVAVAC
jgi:hypothetical protein